MLFRYNGALCLRWESAFEPSILQMAGGEQYMSETLDINSGICKDRAMEATSDS